MLQELRDIVEQIDYARAFCALGGLDFLLASLQSLHKQQREEDNNGSNCCHIPLAIVEQCSCILSTLAMNNPPVQKQLLEMGSIRILTNAYFDLSKKASSENNNNSNRNTAIVRLQSRILQAMSANVRSHALAEQVFCETAQAVPLLEDCLGVVHDNTDTAADENTESTSTPPLSLQQRGLFFLRALVTSDSISLERIEQFGSCIATVIDRFVLADNDSDDNDGDFVQLREMTLAMIQQLLEQANTRGCPPILWSRKDVLVAKGVQRVSALRADIASLSTNDDDNDDDEYQKAQYQSELDQWEAILVLLARSTPSMQTPTSTSAPLMITAPDSTLSQ